MLSSNSNLYPEKRLGLKLSSMTAEPDEQIEFWLRQLKDMNNNSSRSKQEKKQEIEKLREQIRNRLDDQNSNFTDRYVEDVMKRLTDIIGIDSLPD